MEKEEEERWKRGKRISLLLFFFGGGNFEELNPTDLFSVADYLGWINLI